MGIYHIFLKFIPEGKLKNKLRDFGLNFINSFTLGHRTILFDKERKIYGKFCKRPLLGHKDPIETAIKVELKGYIKEYAMKRGDIIIDVGAFQGFFSIYASKLVGPEGLVIAFEPENSGIKILKKNIRLNKLDNVMIVEKGLWRENDVLNFKCEGPRSKLSEFAENKGFSKRINVVELDDFLKKLKISRVNFIKMDIEGAEIEAVKGMEETIKNNNNLHFAIASYHLVNGEKTYKKLEELFKQYGYNVFTDYPEHLTTYAYKRKE